MLLSKLVDSETEAGIRQEMVTMDIRRTREVALLLYQAFQTTGIHGQREMPEDIHSAKSSSSGRSFWLL
jgi:hypothetical protein